MVGLSIARALIEEKRDVVLIEKNAEQRAGLITNWTAWSSTMMAPAPKRSG